MGTNQKQSTENFIKDVRRKTRRLFSSEQKILIVMEALRGEISTAEICRKHGINQALFYKWNKEFMEAGKKRLSGDTTRQATSDGVSEKHYIYIHFQFPEQLFRQSNRYC